MMKRHKGLASCIDCRRLVTWGGTGMMGPDGFLFPISRVQKERFAEEVFAATGIRQEAESYKPGAIGHYCDFPSMRITESAS